MLSPKDITADDLLTVLDNLPIVTVLLDGDGRVRFVNRAGAENTGRRTDDFVGSCGGEALQCVNAVENKEVSGFGSKCDECVVRTAVTETLNNGIHVSRVEAKIHVGWGNGPEEVLALVSTIPLSVAGEDMVLLCVENTPERKHAESALRESEEFSRSIIHSSHDCIKVLDLEGNLLFMSDGGQSLMEIEDIEKYINQSWIGFWEGDDREAAIGAISDAKTGGTGTFRGYCPTDKGSPKWWDVVVSPIYDADYNIVRLLSISRDITRRKQAEEALRRNEERYALAQQAADIGSWDWEITTGKLDWSERIEPIFGLARGEFQGTYHAFLELVHPDDREFVQESVNAAVNEDAEYDIEHRIVWPDGTVRWVSETGRVFRDEGGNAIRMLGIVRDITEHKQVDQIKDEFIGLVSHELRSPLTVIIGAINTVLEEGEFMSPDDTNQLLTDASLEADALSHLVGNLLELSRLQSRRFILYPEPVNIRYLAQDVVRKIQRQWPLHKVKLNISRSIGSVIADPLRVERILYNLVENAVKYSPEGSQIKISARSKNGDVVIGVRDQGDGISPEDQATLFEPFERLEKHRTDGIGGSGVGLSVCQRLVEAHGGYIWVESAPGQGSTFYFTLPQR